MAYDQQSFLAGVSAGRNMQSWPVLSTGGNAVFAMTIRVEESASLPASFFFGARYIPYGTVKWGDGSSTTLQSARGSTHYYDQAGVYQIVFVGKIVGLNLDQGGNHSRYVVVESFDTPVPPIPPDWTLGRSTFVRLSNLEYDTIPAGFFDGITAIPGTYADRLVSVFENARMLRSIPDGIFKRVRFRPSLDTGILSAASLFEDCVALEYVPDDLFDFDGVQYISTMYKAFWTDRGGVRPLNQLSGDFLSKCTSLEDVSECFGSQLFTEGIPLDLFDHCPNITNFRGAFSGISIPAGAIGKPVPELWNQFPNADGTGCFSGYAWQQASNWESIPASWGGPA